jgi:hypothetical protein
MASTIIQAYGSATITVPASSALATTSTQNYSVLSYPALANYPTPVPTVTFSGSGLNTTSAFTNATLVTIQAGGAPVTYNVGTGPVIFDQRLYTTPGTLNATGTLTAAILLTGIVTTTSAAAVTATLDTGALIDAACTFAVNDFFDWACINTGGNTLTVTASTGHTIVGTATVLTVVSARFRTVKTAANTFVTYRIA